MQVVKDSQESLRGGDRSREVSGQQHDVEQPEAPNNHGYDLHGHAHLEAVVNTNLPEPFSAADDGLNLKEGIPEGLSDTPGVAHGHRWTMNDRVQEADDRQN